jgi:hypothetical protein
MIVKISHKSIKDLCYIQYRGKKGSLAWYYIMRDVSPKFLYFASLSVVVFWTATMTFTNHVSIDIESAESAKNLDAAALSSLRTIDPSTGNHQMKLGSPLPGSQLLLLLLPSSSSSSHFSFLSINSPTNQNAYAQSQQENRTTSQAVAKEPDTPTISDTSDGIVNDTDNTSLNDLTANSSRKQPAAVDRDLPDNECLFNPSLEKCAPIGDRCPAGFLKNEDQNCFPDKPCPSGYTKIDDDETGTCHPIEPEKEEEITTASQIAKGKAEEGADKDREISGTPAEEIMKIAKENQTTQALYAKSHACSIISGNSSLTGEIKPNDIRIIVFSYPCKFDSGSVMLKIPDNLSLIAGHFGNESSEATIIPMEKIRPLTLNESSSGPSSASSSIYSVYVNGHMRGEQPSNNDLSSVNDVNTLFLWNSNGNQSIIFGLDNSVLSSIYLRK